MSDPGLVLGHLTFKDDVTKAQIGQKVLDELNSALDNDAFFEFSHEDKEWQVVTYTASLHARASVFRDIVKRHASYIKEFSLAIHALREPSEELYFENGKFKIERVEI